MANCFINAEIVHAERGSSAVGLSAYITRDQQTDHISGEHYSFQTKPGLVAHGMMLPEDAPDWASDAEALWNEAQAAELVNDRKTKETRYAKGAQVAKHYVIALPKELNDQQREQLLKDFVKFHFGSAGVACQWAIHEADEDNGNTHAHVLVSTRRLTSAGFGGKARDLNADFGSRKDAKGQRYSKVTADQKWPDRWADFQNNWFKDNNINLTVDPKKIVRQPHKGPLGHAKDSERTQTAIDAENESEIMARLQPDLVIDRILEMQPTFTKQELRKALGKEGIHGDDLEHLVEKAMTCGRVLTLFEKKNMGETQRYTTSNVYEQELETAGNVRLIAGQANKPLDEVLFNRLCEEATFDAEQWTGARHCLTSRFAIMQGDAGTGKSHTMGVVRRYAEAAGERCWGVAPSNPVAEDMRQDGFRDAASIHGFLIALDKGRVVLNSRSRVICDEAAMADTAVFHRLAAHCAKAGAALTIVGDDKQIQSVARGGIYSELREEHGAALLQNIRRQNTKEMRQASKAISAGNVREALDIYERVDALRFMDTTDAAETELLRDYNDLAASKGRDDPLPFVIAGLNASVDRINKKIQQERITRGEIGGARQTFDVVVNKKAATIEIGVGDRIQMRAGLKKDGIYNGTVATVLGIGKQGQITAKFDSGKTVTIGRDFNEWTLGYCSTIHKSQGKTKPAVLQLRDNAAAGREMSLVGMTRHKTAWRLYVGRDIAKDMDALTRQMSRVQLKRAAIHWHARPYQPEKTDATNTVTNAQSNKHATDDSLRRLPGGDVARSKHGAAEKPALLLHGDAAHQLEQRQPIRPRDVRRPGAREAAALEASPRHIAEAWKTGRKSEAQSPEQYLSARQTLAAAPKLADMHQEAAMVAADRATASEATLRAEAAERARIEAQRVAAAFDALAAQTVAEAARVGIAAFKERFEAEKAARAAAEAERQRLAELERQRLAEQERQRQKAAEAARPKTRSHGWSM